jgi:hypothetical protein
MKVADRLEPAPHKGFRAKYNLPTNIHIGFYMSIYGYREKSRKY